MATVTGLTAARMQEIIDATVESGYIDESGHLILVTYDATEIDAGNVLAVLPDATDSVKGKVELATNGEVITGSDSVRAVTPASLANAITTGKLADDAVTQDKLADDSVGAAQLIDDSVTSAAIADSNVLEAHLASAVLLRLAPTGAVFMWPTATAPSGYLLLDGSLVSRTTYANLFALIGTTFGAGDGTTTFALPNVKGRNVIGFDSSQTEFDALGETGGAKTHTLTPAQLPEHVHGWIGSASGAPANTTDQPFRGNGSMDTGFRMQKELYETETHNSAAITAGQPHNNLGPYLVLNFIIKT